jgi:replicative DNA helicase
MTQELPLPADIFVERMTLGAMICDPEQIDMALGNLTAEDFSELKHKRIYAAMVQLRQEGEPVDRVTLGHALNHAGHIEAVGGMSYIVSLDEGLPQIANIGGYIAILRDKAIARRLISLTNDVQARVRSGEDTFHLLEALRSVGDWLAIKNQQSFETSGQIIERVGLQELLEPSKRSLGIEPPLPWLAERFRFRPKSQTIIAGVTGGGKTALAAQCAFKAAIDGYRVAWYSLEMENEENLLRLIGQIARVNMHRLRMGAGTFQERMDAQEAITILAELKDRILFRDTPIDVQAVNSDLQQLKMQGTPADLVVVDHMHLMESPGRENRTQEVSAISRGLKMVWTRHNIAGLVLAQMNNADEFEEPQLRRLRESGSISHDATNVIFLWPHSALDAEERVRRWRMKLAKCRSGPIGMCDLSFTKRYVIFEQVGG